MQLQQGCSSGCRQCFLTLMRRGGLSRTFNPQPQSQENLLNCFNKVQHSAKQGEQRSSADKGERSSRRGHRSIRGTLHTSCHQRLKRRRLPSVSFLSSHSNSPPLESKVPCPMREGERPAVSERGQQIAAARVLALQQAPLEDGDSRGDSGSHIQHASRLRAAPRPASRPPAPTGPTTHLL